MAEPLLELIEITKTYPGVVALDRVSLSVRSGEVLGLIGENGAGKSTLMKVLGGVVQPTTGSDPHRRAGARRPSASPTRSLRGSPSSTRSSTSSTISTSPPTSSSAASRSAAGRSS